MAVLHPSRSRAFVCTLCTSFVLLAACTNDELPTSTDSHSAPGFLISDGCHNALVGFYWSLPSLQCSTKNLPLHPDPDLAGLSPVVTIRSCSDDNCTSVGAIVAQFTRTSIPAAITYKANQQLYQVSWGNNPPRAAGTYRIDVAAGTTGFRRSLGLADVKLSAKGTTNQPGQVIGWKQADPLMISFQIMIETAGSVTIAPTTATISPAGTQQFTATLRNLHGALLVGRVVKWQTVSSPTTGVIAGLTPTSGPTNASGQTVTTVTAGSTPGSATVYAISNDLAIPHSPVDLLFATAALTVAAPGWTTKRPMQTARGYLGVAAIGGTLYAAGGYQGPDAVMNVEAYDPVANSWTPVTPLQRAKMYVSAAASNGMIYVFGGLTTGPNGTVLNETEAYDPVSNTWTYKAPMPACCLSPGVAALNGIIYVVAPSNGQNASTVDAYDPSTDTWTHKAPITVPREFLSVVADTANGILYAIGGYNVGSGRSLPVVEAYNPSTNTWTRKADMLTVRNSLATVVVNGLVYAIGGDDNADLPTVEAYDPTTNSWSTKPAMPTGRYGLGAATINGVIYTVGGFNNSTAQATVEALSP